jgi:uncharacterized RDD family membrane protein YckC
MKCPKCGYLGFEDMERCRNCGYDFSLTETASPPELNLRRDTRKLSPLDDLSLVDAAMQQRVPSPEPMDDEGMVFRPTPSRPTRSSSELPLFRSEAAGADDEPLIKRASPPRAPLAVRRATPEVPRLRGAVRAQSLDFALDLDDPLDVEPGVFSPAERATAEEWPAPRPERAEAAALGERLFAVLIDLAILAVVDAAVLYFTLKICGVGIDELSLIPKAPLLAFLLFQNGGYLAAFTAGGQTLGKMATGIRVVATESAGTLDLNRAITRTLVWLLLAVPAGLGFLTVFGRDHRGLHDRVAGTRVVRATA